MMGSLAFEKRIVSWWCSVLELIWGSYSSTAEHSSLWGCNTVIRWVVPNLLEYKGPLTFSIRQYKNTASFIPELLTGRRSVFFIPLLLSAIIEGGFPTHLPLQHMQKDLKLSLYMGDQLEQPLPLTASTNELFKHAKRLGYGEHDASAVYIRARFWMLP